MSLDHQDGKYRIGERVTLDVLSTKDCYLNIIDVGTSGRVTILFPNQVTPNNFLRANVPYRFPQPGVDFVVSGPTGKELVKVICTQPQAALFNMALAEQAGPYKSFPETASRAMTKDIRVQLSQVPAQAWTETHKTITIKKALGAATPTSGPVNAPTASPAFAATLSTDKPSYRVGEPIRFSFTVTRDAYVTLMNIGTSGRVQVLFPNRFSPKNFCQAGVVYTVPVSANSAEQYVAIGPPGVEVVKLIATQNQGQWPWGPYDSQTAPYPVLTRDAKTVTKDIQVMLSQPAAGSYHDEA